MNMDTKRLHKLIEKKLPGAEVEIHALKSGIVQIDVAAKGRSFAIEYRPKIGFGLTSLDQPGGDALFGSGAHEVYLDEAALLDRLAALVKKKVHTVPQRALLLQEIRAALGVSQSELADRLQIRQPSLSKIERSSRLQLDTLQRYVAALGGKLKLVADVDGQHYEVRVPMDSEAPAHED